MQDPSQRRESLFEFVTNLDARAWRAVAVTLGLFLVVGIILLLGRLIFGEQVNEIVEAWLGGAERAHWGLPAAMLVFTIAALIGAPQFVLIAACVVAFGPEKGFWYAWAATIVSGAVTFVMGKFAGADTLKRFSGATGGRFSRFMGRNGFLASLVIRLVPSAPFIVVNMAMGAAGMNAIAFLAGLAIGVLPKTAIVAFAGDGVMDFLEGNVEAAIWAAAAAIVIWIVAVVVVRRMVRPALGEVTSAEGADASDGDTPPRA